MNQKDRDRIIQLSGLGLRAATIAYVMRPLVSLEQVKAVVAEELAKRAKKGGKDVVVKTVPKRAVGKHKKGL